MKRHILSILVENHAGVLSKVTGLFSRRGFNIDSLAVSTTDSDEFSRITIMVSGDDAIVEQIKKQVSKLIEVIKINEFTADEAVSRELVMIKVKANSGNRQDIIQIVDIFRAKIVDVSKNTLMIELTGNDEKLTAFEAMLKEYGIVEVVRTGVIAMERGAHT